jgi:hypothetical protein
MPCDDLDTRIAALDDANALRLLRTVTEPRLRAGEVTEEQAAPGMMAALWEEFGADPATNPSDGEAARIALRLLAQDPQYREPLGYLVSAPPPQRMVEPVTATLLAAGVLLALQAHVKIEYKDGKWSFLYEKKPTTEPLIQKLLGFLRPGNPS